MNEVPVVPKAAKATNQSQRTSIEHRCIAALAMFFRSRSTLIHCGDATFVSGCGVCGAFFGR